MFVQNSNFFYKMKLFEHDREGMELGNTQPIAKTSRTFLFIIMIALLTALGSEIKIMPFENAPFRFGLGSIIFFFALLIRPLPLITTGVITGLTVTVFRAIIGSLFLEGQFNEQLIEHFPAALFYISFAICLKAIPLERIKVHPFILGLFGVSFEVLANIIEQTATTIFVTQQWANIDSYLLLFVVGFLRSFFVMGLYSAISLSEQKKQRQLLLAINSELYVEALYLQKSMEQIEQLTADSFQLYKRLKLVDRKLGNEALRISQEIHEVKKDHERIYAGISKIVSAERADSFLLSDLLYFIVEANESYAKFLNKDIYFKLICPRDLKTDEHIALMAILNNLVANAVEAIDQQGEISLNVTSTILYTTFTVIDDGKGIDEAVLPIIFDAGYTSKFNASGAASTGIGLSHVQTIIERLQGTIEVTSEQTTNFSVTIPTKHLRKKEI